MKWIDDSRAWLRVKARERKERAAEKKAARAPLPHGAAPIAWCVLLTMVGVAALSGSTWMLLVFIAGSVGRFDWFSSYVAGTEGPGHFTWSLVMDVHWAVAIGLFLFCLAIAMFNATWLEARKHLYGAIRVIITSIGVAVALFMISGAIVVQQRGTDARAQDDAVAIQTAQVGVAAARERLDTARQTLREMRNHSNQYMAVAATVGAAEFERSYLSPEQRARETPERLRLLERSLGAARRADALETEIGTLEQQTAQAAVGAAHAEAVTVRAGGFMAPVVTALEDARKPITAMLGELLALTAFGFALAAWRSRQTARDVERSGWADEGHRIEDLRAEDPIASQPMRPSREVVTDAETGEELVRVRESKPRDYWRKVKKGQRTKVDVTPDAQPDETGVTADGGNRMAMSPAGPIDVEALVEPQANTGPAIAPVETEHPSANESDDANQNRNEHPEPLSDDEIALLSDLPVETSDAEQDGGDRSEPDQQSEHVELPENEGVMVAQDETEREPETDPSRLIPASVAAE